MTKAMTACSTAMDHAAASDVAVCLKALAHPARLLILQALQAGEKSVSALEADTGVHQPILSRELAKMRDTGLVEARRVSKAVFYRQACALDLSGLQSVLGLASEQGAGQPAAQAAPSLTASTRPMAGQPAASKRALPKGTSTRDTSASLFARAGWSQA